MHAMVTIQKDTLEFLANRAGPYSKPDSETGAVVKGFWHKPDHSGSDTCAGCAIEEALQSPVASGRGPA